MSKLKKYRKIAKKIYQVLPKYQQMTDEELQDQTRIFQEELAGGRTLTQLLPRTFAVSMEADRRVLGLSPYEVQVLGGLALFFGNIAEMKTGEGKTLVATLPMYARAVAGNRGNFLITTNDYLVERDGKEIGAVYEWLGLSVGIGVDVEEDDEKRQLYANDIIYTTHSTLGFHYLFDNLGTELSKQYVKRFNFVIVDEIDSVLLDAAQTSLVISGAPKVQSNYFEISDWFVKSMEDDDYEFSEDKKKVWFTPQGLDKIEEYFDIDDIFSEQYFDQYRHLVLALQANMLKKNGQEYVVEDGKVVLLDEVNGRKMDGVKLNGGLHQAIEAKEEVDVTAETKTLGMISYQSLFHKFKVLSGMTGTAKTDEKEFIQTYNLKVVEIPTNKPSRRIDQPDQVYLTNRAKIDHSLATVQAGMAAKRPVLIETGSVTMSNLYSLVLLENRIPHNLLNASTAPREKLIVSEAGQTDSITLATSMAGRGTDIKLSKEAKENGGLLAVGTERMTSKRIDNQLRGRAGRQGEPGESQFMVSLEDKIVVENGPDRLRKFYEHGQKRVEKGKLDPNNALKQRVAVHAMDNAQKKVGNSELESRKETTGYDAIMSNQREKIYVARNRVLAQDPAYLNALINGALEKVIDNFISDHRKMQLNDITNFVYNNIDTGFSFQRIKDGLNGNFKKKNVRQFLMAAAREALQRSLDRFRSPMQLAYYKKVVILKAIDTCWIDQLDYLQQLKMIVTGRSAAQHKPITEFTLDSRRGFFRMENEAWLAMFRNLILTELDQNKDGSLEMTFP